MRGPLAPITVLSLSQKLNAVHNGIVSVNLELLAGIPGTVAMATDCAPFGVCPVRVRRGSEGCYRGVFSTEPGAHCC